MAIKINGDTVIDDSRVMQNIVGNEGTVYTMYNATYPLSATTDNINFSTPFMSCVLDAATTFTETSVAVGKSAQMLLDVTTTGYTPTWSSNINWAEGTEPTWGDYQRWHIFFTVVATDEIRATAFGYEDITGVGTPSAWPAAAANNVRAGDTGNRSAYSDEHVNGNLGATGSVSGSSSVGTKIEHRSPQGTSIVLSWDGTGGAQPGYWNTSNNFINRSQGQTYEAWTETSLSPDSCRLVRKSVGGSVVSDTGYVSIGNAGDSLTSFASVSRSRSMAGSSSGSSEQLVECWLRKTGYVDTKVITYRHFVEVYVSASGCFLGSANLYRWNTDTNTADIVTMSDAYTQFVAKEEDAVHYVIGADGLNKEIIAFGKFALEDTFYAFNGNDTFVSSSHPFLTTDGWKCCNLEDGNHDYPDLDLTQLAVGDILQKYNAATNEYYQEELTSITPLTGTTKEVYLLDVGGDDTYVVDGYVVHNK